MSCLIAFHYRSYGTFFLQQNRLHKIHRGLPTTNIIEPKKTDLAAISDEALKKVLYDINHRPRKCLAYRNACESLEDEFK